MQTINSLEKRLENLEKGKGKEQKEEKRIRFIIVDVHGRDDEPKPSTPSTSEIIEKCEAACDKETFNKALGAAFVAIVGKNPLESEDVIIIEMGIAVKTVEKLRAAGIVVDVDVDGIELTE